MYQEFLSYPGFWLRESTYREQPDVNFKHQVILLLQGSDINTLVTYSTYQNYNNLMADNIRIPFIQVYQNFYLLLSLGVKVNFLNKRTCLQLLHNFYHYDAFIIWCNGVIKCTTIKLVGPP